jgi:hypothetical protein
VQDHLPLVLLPHCKCQPVVLPHVPPKAQRRLIDATALEEDLKCIELMQGLVQEIACGEEELARCSKRGVAHSSCPSILTRKSACVARKLFIVRLGAVPPRLVKQIG